MTLGMQRVAQLRGKIAGDVFALGDAGYDSAKRGQGTSPVNGRHPAVVIHPANPTDIARAIEFARANSIDLSVRCGGHDMLGASTTASGILLDLRCLTQTHLDPSTGVIRVAGGARAESVLAAGGPHGLAPILGMSPHVGVSGLALGGGIGWLSGSYGAAVDHVLAVSIVTADGQHLSASAQENPDLFWALRGGGGNFGVATELTLQLHPVDQVLAGSVTFAADDPRGILRFIRDFLSESDDALDTELSFALGDKPSATVRLCWSGEVEAGLKAIQPLRALKPIVKDTVAVRRYTDFVAGYPQVNTMFLRGGELDALHENAIEAFVEIVEKGGPEECGVGLLHYMHGALCRAPANSTPFVRPAGHILYNIVAPSTSSTPDPGRVHWAMATWDTLKEVSSPRTYLNYLCSEDEASVSASFGQHYQRLQAIKRRYDPSNLFHNGRNIRPQLSPI